MNRHKVKTSILIWYLMASLFAVIGCEGMDSLNRSGPGQPYSWLTDEEKAADARRPVIITDSDDNYWKTEWEIEKLRRLEEQQRLDTARINENTRQMLLKSKIQRELQKRPKR